METKTTDETCIIVVCIGDIEIGIVVDRVLEVQDIAEDDIQDTPEMDAGVDANNILGMSKADGKVTILLDIEKVLGGAHFAAIEHDTAFSNMA